MGKCWRGGLRWGSPGLFNRPVCVMDMVAPSDKVAEMLLLAVVKSSKLFEFLNKWPVAPESMTVVLFKCEEGVDCVDIRVFLVIFILVAVFTCLGGPLDQDRCKQELDTKLVVVPPIMLLAVAST
jgi:hypothetical protein